jgi:uncharacterized membrane protein YgcG
MRKKVASAILACVVSFAVAFAMTPSWLEAGPYPRPVPSPQTAPPPQEQPQSAQLTPDQLQQLVAPIALYPDALVAQILAASAYPTQIVEAERFLEQDPKLKGADLAKKVDKQDWDPSVKALTAFPTVLSHMDQDLSWTSALGDANLNQAGDVMDAIQFLRKKAQDAGNLKTTPQQNVTDQNGSVIIQPADPQIVYVPDYDPDLIYGYPVGLWPGFFPWWGVTGPYISFGVGFGIGPFFGFGWGWPVWGFDWYHHRGLLYAGAPYAFRSHAFYDRNAYFHGNYRGFAPYARGDRGMRGFGAPAGRPPSGVRSGAFGGFGRGGDVRGFSSRGQSSMGARGFGGGGFRGGGGFHGGGGGRR